MGRGMPSRAPRRWRGGAMRTSCPTAKPHTAPMARRRDEDIAPYRHAARGVRGDGARDAKPRTAPMARRRDEDIAPYR